MTITVLTNMGCPPCRVTKRKLDSLGVEYVERSLSDDAEAYDLAVGLGHKAAPVVIVERPGGSVEHWSGYRPDLLAALSQAS